MIKRSIPKYDEMGFTKWLWRVLHRENFKLGNNTEIGSFTVIDAQYGVTIEDNVKIGWSCSIFSNSSIDGKKGSILLKKGCCIGANTVIMPNVTIGKNAIVGACSFVNKNINDDTIFINNRIMQHRVYL